MFIYHSAQVIYDLCSQIGLTVILILDEVVIFVLKEFYACVLDFYQCTCPVLVVTDIELDSVIMARYQNTIFFFAVAFFVQFAILLLRVGANFTKLLCFRTS